ncbi:AMP-binding protein [Lysobacter niastensis]|uniref:Acyl-CoA synthetase n=1 Tax=Lysobacter niastensis TaxID=380629 RepID=A0ABS0B477_9GAMM|nr:AMP-binding protein [Lysobacter niastensis]MBF6023364.1 acyl-CoA synthetase [Lysobacter niastensis]
MTEWIGLDRIASRPLPGRTVALANGRALDHAAFRDEASRWRSAFEAAPGSRWALYFDDTAAFAAALFGAWHTGKAVYLCGDNLPETVARLRAEVDGFAGDFANEDVLTAGAPHAAAEWPPLDEDATHLMVFTSGSTGDATAIGKTLSQLAREVEALQATFGDTLGDAIVHGTVSHQHIYGLLFRLLWPLASGRPIAPRLFFHEEIVAALDRPALLVSSPAHLKRMPDTLDWSNARTHLRAVFSSGGALPQDAAAAAGHLLGLAPTEIYGSSETGGIAWRQWRGATPPWRALPGVEWRIADEHLEVSSPHLPTRDWWRSEDRAEADGAQGFRLTGRADRIVKIEERRVSLGALERQLASLPQVAEVRVVVLPEARLQLAAVVVPSSDGAARLANEGRRAFARALNDGLADAQDAVTRPRRWRFVDALPMNAQGKVREADLRALFRPERPQPQWLSRSDTSAELEIVLDPELAVFDGHFPQIAILPGVAQLDWAVRWGREAFALPPRFLRMEMLKFQRVLRPGARVRLHLEWLQAKSALGFRYESEHGAHASGRVVFGEEAV